MKKNDSLIGRCVDYTHEGLGVVKVDDFTFFIPRILRDEQVKFKVVKLNKHYGYGKLLDVIEVSSHRVTPFCSYFDKCGGCHLQHMDADEQAYFKQNLVQNNMRRIAKSDVEIQALMPGEHEGYRNKAQFPLCTTPTFAMGFYRLHSNEIVNLEQCPIQSDRINEVYACLRMLLPTCESASLLRHVLIKHAFVTNEVMVVFIAKKDIHRSLAPLVEQLVKRCSITSCILNINANTTNVILGDTERLLYGKSYICEQLEEYKFHISATSFYQVNPEQTRKLYNKVLEFAALTKHDVVIDLYCGVGSISLFLASQAKKVIGIEVVEAAIVNAKANAVLNKLDNVEFVCSDAADYAERLLQEGMAPDVVVVDPPRKGCERSIESIVKMNPQRIVYVSCNPATLARDINIFEQYQYQCMMVQPVDMFPNTYHVETIVLLCRKN